MSQAKMGHIIIEEIPHISATRAVNLGAYLAIGFWLGTIVFLIVAALPLGCIFFTLMVAVS